LTHLPLVHTNTVFSFDIYESWTGIVKAGGDEGTDDSLRMRIRMLEEAKMWDPR